MYYSIAEIIIIAGACAFFVGALGALAKGADIIVDRILLRKYSYRRIMKYKKGYKYQLTEDTKVYYSKCAFPCVTGDFYEITDCYIEGKKGYAWDGPSGPTLDTPATMEAALVHDIIYQALREQKIRGDHEYYRRAADQLLRDLIVKNGGSKFRAWYFYWAVRLFAKFAADPENKKETIAV